MTVVIEMKFLITWRINMKRLVPRILLIVFALTLIFAGWRLIKQGSAPSENGNLLGSTSEDGNQAGSILAENENSTEQVEGKIDIPVAGYASIPQSSGLLQGNTPMTYVGLGYNVLDRTYIVPNGFSRGRPIFNPDEIKKRLHTDIPTDNSTTMIIGSSVSEYSNKMKSNLSLSADYPIFSGNLSAEYDMSKANKKNTYFVKSISGYIKESQYIPITKDLHTILDKTFEEDLNSDMSPELLFEKYGTHVLVEALMGARCTYNYTYSAESSEEYSSIQSKIDLAYKYVSGSASIQEEQTAKDFLYNCYFHCQLSGGPNIDHTTFSKLLENFPTWVDKLKDSVPTIFGVSNSNSLIPIWDYAENETRVNELKDYFYQRGGDIQKLLDNMSKIPEEPSTKSYIEDIIITSDKEDKVARDGSAYSGYTMIDKDLNEEAGGDYIYLWYKTTTDKDKALRDIRFTYDDFKDIPNFYIKNAHDLNAEAGGQYIYMWTTKRSSIGEPITDIKVLFGKNANMPIGYESSMVNYYQKGDMVRERAELNSGAGGYYIYLGYSYK